ncbi:MAG: HAD-IA family hydrolase [Actinobacteria bacterium]|nr:HAD-IA family hydrolase [Actinomycetota bacterium]
MAVKALIFDLDGTLVDSLEDLADTMNHCLGALGLPVHETQDYRMLIGTGSRELCRKALPPERADLTNKLLEMNLDRYTQHCLDKTKPYPGIVETLDELIGRHLHLAVLSNKPDNFVKLITRSIFGSDRFEMIIGQQDGLPTKPDPSGVLDILRRMRGTPEETLYVGDSGTDMTTALAAGATAVGVSWGFRDRSELSAAGAHHIIDKPAQLLELL